MGARKRTQDARYASCLIWSSAAASSYLDGRKLPRKIRNVTQRFAAFASLAGSARCTGDRAREALVATADGLGIVPELRLMQG